MDARTHARSMHGWGILHRAGRGGQGLEIISALSAVCSLRARARTHTPADTMREIQRDSEIGWAEVGRGSTCVHVVLADLIRITQYAGRPAGWPGSSAMGRRRRGCVRACMRYQRAIEEDPGSIGSTRQPRRTACCRPGRGERGSRRDQLLAATTSPLFWACICMCVVYALAS